MDGKNSVIARWPMHVVAWAILFGMPLFLARPDKPMVDAWEYLHFCIISLSFVFVFYANYSFLIRKTLFQHKVLLFFIYNFVLILAMIYGIRFISEQFFAPPADVEKAREAASLLHHIRFIVGNTLIYMFVVGASVAIKMTGAWYGGEASRTEAELQNLKSQINPHFLFNTLNNIYSLIQIDTDRAQKAVHDLSRTLRYVLYDSSSQTVPLKSETAFLKEYIALMKMRLPSHVELTESFPDDGDPVLNKAIAPMLFISLVENAFKHGVSNEKPSFISIDFHAEGSHIVCDIRNSNFPKTDSDRSGSGIGIENLERRLSLIYPGKYRYEYGAVEGEYHSLLDIDLD
ncbi:MAG: histidine kinase [Bacteroidales bacterium]|nr:histidine kinase [Bacteroidales bacterium]